MTFGLDLEKILLIGLIAALLIGPERLPGIAEKFTRLVRRAGEYLRDTKSRVREEMGPEIDDVDWRKLDPRQYDPRRIIRDALFEEPQVAAAATATVAAAKAPAAPRPKVAAPSEFSTATPPPYDLEAT